MLEKSNVQHFIFYQYKTNYGCRHRDFFLVSSACCKTEKVQMAAFMLASGWYIFLAETLHRQPLS